MCTTRNLGGMHDFCIKNAATGWKLYCVVYVGVKGKVVKLCRWIKNETVRCQGPRNNKTLGGEDRRTGLPQAPLLG